MKRTLKPAIAYTRVSTQKQAEHGHGLQLQMDVIREFARHAGYEIVESFSDAETGMGEKSIRDRPDVVKAIKLAKERRWPILVDELERFSRNVPAIQDVVVKKKLEVISCRSGEDASHAVIMARARRAESEGELISRNTMRGLRAAKDRGVLLGNRTNLGEAQRKGTAATKARTEERVREFVPIVRELRASGRKTSKAIAEGLNLRGMRTPRGEDWTGGNVRRLLVGVDELEQAQERAQNTANPLWGMF